MAARKDARFTVCCTLDLYSRIKAVAEDNQRTVSNTVVILLEKALAEIKNDYLDKIL